MTCATAYNVLSAAKEHAQSPIGLYAAFRNPVAIPSRSLMMEFFPTSKTIQYAMILAITDGREITLRRTALQPNLKKTARKKPLAGFLIKPPGKNRQMS